MTRCVLLTALLLIVCVAPMWAKDSSPRPLVIILIPGTTLADWRAADAPTLHRIMAEGSLAVMNTRTARLPNDHKRESPESAALTLGAGSRAAGGGEVTDFHPASQRVSSASLTYGQLHTRRTGTVPRDGVEVNAEWPKVQQENSGQNYDLRPGNLGDGLKRHGIPTLAGGGRFAPPVACDSDGTVDAIPERQGLPGRLPPFLVWDASPDVASAGAVIRQAAAEVSAQRGRLMIVSPFVGDQAYSRGEQLAPVAVWGTDVPPGLLFSPSTHRAGLVTNTDVAPCVAAFFGATPQRPWFVAAPLGRTWEFRPQSDAVAEVMGLEAAAYRQASAMRVLPLVAVGLGLLMLVGVVCRRRGSLFPPMLWLPGVVILALLVSTSLLALGLWIATLGIVYGSLQSRVRVGRLSALSAASVVLVMIGDTLMGNPLMRVDLLGYSAVEGARYYGIGNEAMGALVGSALVVAARFWGRDNRSRLAISAALTGLALMLGLPGGGAKAGGLLVAIAAFGAFLWTAWGKSWNVRVVAGIITAMVVSLALAALSDWHRDTQAQSHLGAAVGRISSGGISEALDIVSRKLAVECRLLYHSAWAVPLWVCVIGLCYEAERLYHDTGRDGNTKALVFGGAAAMLACLTTNDAGVVAAALCGVMVLSSLSATKKSPRRTEMLSGGGLSG